MSNLPPATFEIPATFRHSQSQPVSFRRDLLRSGELIPWLTSLIRQATGLNGEQREAWALALSDWTHSWENEAQTEAEIVWLERLVTLVNELIRTGSAEPVINSGVLADWPEAPAYAALLKADAGIDSEASPREVRVPVVFIPGNEDNGQPTVALLELRLFAGVDEFHVHPADRWRRDKLGAEQAGPAETDFVEELADAVKLARAHWAATAKPPRSGTVLWRLLDVHAPDQPCSLQTVLKGPSAGGAALRAALHLLGSGELELPPRVFVLAQLGRDDTGVPDGTLAPVRGVKAKILALTASLDGPDALHRYRALIVLPELVPTALIPPEVGEEEIYPTTVTAISALTAVGSSPAGSRIRLGATPGFVENLKDGLVHQRKLILMTIIGAGLFAFIYLGWDQHQKTELEEQRRLEAAQAEQRRAEDQANAEKEKAANERRINEVEAKQLLQLNREIFDEMMIQYNANKAEQDSKNVPHEVHKKQALSIVLGKREKSTGKTSKHYKESIEFFLSEIDENSPVKDQSRLAFWKGDFDRATKLVLREDYAVLQISEPHLEDKVRLSINDEQPVQGSYELLEGLTLGGRAAHAARRYAVAVTAFERAIKLTRYTWEELQNQLGRVYLDWAEKSSGIERLARSDKAVTAYRASLQVYARFSHMPNEWAEGQRDLAEALRFRAALSEGLERAHILNEAASAYRSALQVWTKDASPRYWAETQIDLAGTLGDQANAFEGAERSRLLGEAVNAYRAAQEVYTRETQHLNWARSQTRLVDTLSAQASASEGAERARLLGEAVSASRALVEGPLSEISDRNILANLIHQASASNEAERAPLLDEAVSMYRAVSGVYSPADGADWYYTQRDLARALRKQGSMCDGKQRTQLLEEAAAIYQTMIEIFIKDEPLRIQAGIQINLADLLIELASNSSENQRTQLLEHATSIYRSVTESLISEEPPYVRDEEEINLANLLIELAGNSDGNERDQILFWTVSIYQNLIEGYYENAAAVWAETQKNLAYVYLELANNSIDKQRTRLMEEAVAAFRKALESYNAKELPVFDWVKAQNALADTLIELANSSDGKQRADLMDQAVAAYRCAARQAYTPETLPYYWVETQNNLVYELYGDASGSNGDKRAQLLAQAVAACRNTLKFYDPLWPNRDLANLQTYTADLLIDLASVSDENLRASLLTEAIAAYQNALKFYTREELPHQWAMNQNSISYTLSKLAAIGKSTKRLEIYTQANSAAQASLEVLTRATDPNAWAMVQDTLAVALRGMANTSAESSQVQLFTESIQASHASLEVITMTTEPETWAEVVSNLAQTVRDFAAITPPDTRATKLLKAIYYQRAAFKVWTKEEKPEWYKEQVEWIEKAEAEIEQLNEPPSRLILPV